MNKLSIELCELISEEGMSNLFGGTGELEEINNGLLCDEINNNGICNNINNDGNCSAINNGEVCFKPNY